MARRRLRLPDRGLARRRQGPGRAVRRRGGVRRLTGYRQGARPHDESGGILMAINGWLAADSDMHVMEPADLWQRYMDPAWEHAAPVGMTEIERDMRVKVKNQVMLRLGRMRPRAAGRPWKAEQDSVYIHAEERGWDAKSQIMAMDIEHL